MTNNKKDSLEEFVLQNKDAFDSFDPPTDMFSRISKDLEQNRKKETKIRPLYYLQRVAAAVIILLAGYGIVDISRNFTKSNDTKTIAAIYETENNQATELGETMLYYISQVNSKRDELEEKAAQYPDIVNEIKTEFTDLDTEYENLENDLKEDASNSAVIEAMINTAKIKLEILEEMQQQLNKMDQNENANHEIHIQI